MSAMAPFIHRFDADLARLAALPEPAWLSARRRESYARFQEEGLPTQRDEEWKYTSLAPLERTLLATQETRVACRLLTPFHALTPLQREYASGQALPGQVADLPEGVTLMPLGQALVESRPAAMEYFGSLAREEALADFNTALWSDGLYLEVAPGVTLPHALYVQQVGSAGGSAQLRHLLVLGTDSQATLIQHSLSAEAGAHFTNSVCEITLGRGARLTHIELQEENPDALHVARTAAQLGADSRYDHLAVSAGGALTRNELLLRLSGQGAECRLNGLSVGRGRSHTDQHLLVEHAHAGGTSRQLYKSILWDRARSVFDGHVRVAPGATKTDARQVNRNLLLSNDAEADSKPQLEIFADDVKCSHGSATGGLDPAQLFYLRARGLDEADARSILVEAFAAEVLGEALSAGDEALRAALVAWLRDKLENRHAA